MNELFKDAKFGDRFRMRNGNMAVYIGSKKNYAELCFEEEEYGYKSVRFVLFYDNGRYVEGKEREFDIICKWEEEKL